MQEQVADATQAFESMQEFRKSETRSLQDAVKTGALTVTQALHLLNGPAVSGFNESKEDPPMTDTFVRDVLVRAFTLETLWNARVGEIRKHSEYLLYGRGFPERADIAREKGFGKFDDALFLITANRENYIQAAMIMEGIENASHLQHTFKVRARVDNTKPFGAIDLYSFGVERVEDFDYLHGTGLCDEDAMRAYILGTAAHEIGHKIGHILMGSSAGVTDDGLDLPPEQAYLLQKYQNIVRTEKSAIREQYVTDYALRHAKKYKSSDSLAAHEDFVESIRVFLTNPDYMQKYYPARLGFLREQLPYLREGAIAQALLTI